MSSVSSSARVAQREEWLASPEYTAWKDRQERWQSSERHKWGEQVKHTKLPRVDVNLGGAPSQKLTNSRFINEPQMHNNAGPHRQYGNAYGSASKSATTPSPQQPLSANNFFNGADLANMPPEIYKELRAQYNEMIAVMRASGKDGNTQAYGERMLNEAEGMWLKANKTDADKCAVSFEALAAYQRASQKHGAFGEYSNHELRPHHSLPYHAKQLPTSIASSFTPPPSPYDLSSEFASRSHNDLQKLLPPPPPMYNNISKSSFFGDPIQIPTTPSVVPIAHSIVRQNSAFLTLNDDKPPVFYPVRDTNCCLSFCRFNPTHAIRSEELLSHESNECVDRLFYNGLLNHHTWSKVVE